MKKIFLTVILSLVLSVTAFASYITLNTAVDSQVEKGVLKVLVSSVNSGDESAHNVQAEIRVGAAVLLGQKVSELGIGKTYKAFFELKPGVKMSGSYPLIVSLHYTDANQYPFSALTVPTFVYQAEKVAGIFGQLTSTRFAKNGALHLTLKNLGQDKLPFVSRLVIPRELTVVQEKQSASLVARSKQKLAFKLENFSALPGSTYQAFALTEYEKEGFHYTVVSSGTVTIVEDNFFKNYQLGLFVLAAVLLASFILLQFKIGFK